MKIYFIAAFLALFSVGTYFVTRSAVTWKIENPLQTRQAEAESPSQTRRIANPVQILFGGDMQFDRYIRTVMQARGNDFVLAPLEATLQEADLVVANLEGPITDAQSVSVASREGEAKNYVFTFPSATALYLKTKHIDLVNIGNNHILNFKDEGVEATKKYLGAAGVGFFGSPLAGDDRTYLETVKGVKFGFVNYNQFVTGAREKAMADIQSLRKRVDFLVLYTHWGVEYTTPSESVKTLAHAFIDAGVDLVIGSHPHVVQEKEIYQDKTIYYSLGNFLFDQYFRPETQAGLLVRATFDPGLKRITTEEIPITLKPTGQTIQTATH